MRISREKLEHMIGVAEYMSDNAQNYLLLPQSMYLLGLIHEIGCLSKNYEHNDADAAKFIQDLARDLDECVDNKESVVSHVIKNHKLTPREYHKLYGVPPAELYLLWEADMSVTEDGKRCTFEEKLKEIEALNGVDSREYTRCQMTINFINNLNSMGFTENLRLLSQD